MGLLCLFFSTTIAATASAAASSGEVINIMVAVYLSKILLNNLVFQFFQFSE